MKTQMTYAGLRGRVWFRIFPASLATMGIGIAILATGRIHGPRRITLPHRDAHDVRRRHRLGNLGIPRDDRRLQEMMGRQTQALLQPPGNGNTS